MKPRKVRSKMTADEKAAASLRKRSNVWWTHFGIKGEFFRFSLGTSDRSKAKREAKRLIALAAAGKIAATASSPAESKARRSASLRKSNTDPKVSAATKRRAVKRWKKATDEERKAHGDAIRGSLTPERLLARSKTTKGLWKNDDYADSHIRSSKKYWSKKSHRKKQSRKLKAACARHDVKQSRLAGRLRFARKFLRRNGVLAAPQKRGRKQVPAEETTWFKIGAEIERKIPAASRSDGVAIVAARKSYAVETGLPQEMCSRYHSRYRRWLRNL